MHVTYEFHSADPLDYDAYSGGSRTGRVGLAVDTKDSPVECLKQAIDKALGGEMLRGTGIHGPLEPGCYLVVQRPDPGGFEPGNTWIDGWSWHVDIEVPVRPTVHISGEF